MYLYILVFAIPNVSEVLARKLFYNNQYSYIGTYIHIELYSITNIRIQNCNNFNEESCIYSYRHMPHHASPISKQADMSNDMFCK